MWMCSKVGPIGHILHALPFYSYLKSQKSHDSETVNFWITFFKRFFEMPLQKNVKSHVFLDFQKNVKKRILELCLRISFRCADRRSRIIL